MEPGELSRESEGDSATSLLLALVRSRWLVLGGVLLGAAAGVAYGIVQPNSYLSYGKLLVRYGTREEVSPEAVVGGGSQQGGGQTRNLVINEIEVLSVPQVFERVAREVTPARIFSSYDPSAMDTADTPLPFVLFHRFQAWWFRRSNSEQAAKVGHSLDDCPRCVSEAAHELSENMRLGAEPESSVITVSYVAQDPALARQIVDSFLTAAEERHRESYNTNSTLEFVSERLTESLAEVQAAENEFNDYRLSCEVYDYTAQRTASMTEVRDLEHELAQGVSTLAELKGRSTVLTALLADQPATIEQQVERPPLADPRWTQLQDRLFELENSLDALDARVGGTTQERDTERKLLLQRIESTKTALKSQNEWVQQSPTIQHVPDPRHQRLTEELDNLKLSIAAQEASTGEKSESLQKARRKLISTEQCEPRYHFLEASVRNAQDKYNAYLKAHERTNLMTLLDQVEFSNLRRIQDATVPYGKEGPKRAKFLVVGVLLGAFAGAVLGFLRHQIDPFVRTPNDLEHLLGVKVVGVTPRSRLPWRLRRAIRRALRSAAAL